LEAFALWLVSFIHGVGYPGIFIGMAVGNMLVPIPVELVMIPAGYLVEQGEMNFWFAIGCAIAGDICGSLVSFYVAFHFGRRVLVAFGKHLFFGQDKIEMLDRFFASHGEMSTLTGRLMPGLRHFMAFPAGLSHMHVKKFIIYTGVGGGLWSGILIWIGYLVGGNKDLVKHYMSYVECIVIGGVILMVVLYIKRHRKKKIEEV
jgi:membrane protein DedA with SNARE-associated domain